MLIRSDSSRKERWVRKVNAKAILKLSLVVLLAAASPTLVISQSWLINNPGLKAKLDALGSLKGANERESFINGTMKEMENQGQFIDESSFISYVAEKEDINLLNSPQCSVFLKTSDELMDLVTRVDVTSSREIGKVLVKIEQLSETSKTGTICYKMPNGTSRYSSRIPNEIKGLPGITGVCLLGNEISINDNPECPDIMQTAIRERTVGEWQMYLTQTKYSIINAEMIRTIEQQEQGQSSSTPNIPINPVPAPSNKENQPPPVQPTTPPIMTIHEAVEEGNINLTRSLISKNGKLLNSRDKNGNTPLHLACSEGNEEIVRFLISRGAAINVKNTVDNLTPLHFAVAKSRKYSICKLLIDKGADVNAATKTRHLTCLHAAALNCDFEIAQLLLAHGAKPNPRQFGGEFDGYTPLRNATMNHCHETMALISQYGGTF
jgi:hypothetical protein